MGRAKRRARPLWTLQRLCFEPDVAADPSDRGENRDPGTATEAIKMHLTVETQLANAPRRHLRAKVTVSNCHLKEASTEQAITIGLDIAKHIFQVHGADGLASGKWRVPYEV